MFPYDLSLLERDRPIFQEDYEGAAEALLAFFTGTRVLVVGGAGSIGQEVVKLLARYDLAALHIVDCSENNLTELTRDFRSTIGYIDADTQFLPLDATTDIFDAFLEAQAPYDIILNFSAMKHVRSEKDPWSLMRMIDINIFVSQKLLAYANRVNAKKYFCVSTDKAQNPGNLMGATKRIMECYLSSADNKVPVSTARFANVAFSDGSLPFGFLRRLEKRQPLSAPSDVRRYFVTGEEAGILCLMSIGMGQDQEIFFPRLDAEKQTTTFAAIAEKFLRHHGYEPLICVSEDAARAAMETAPDQGQWPCHFFKSDTTGEKPLEEFYGDGDQLNLNRFQDMGVIEGLPVVDDATLKRFEETLASLKSRGSWTKAELAKLVEETLPDYKHVEKNKSLDERM